MQFMEWQSGVFVLGPVRVLAVKVLLGKDSVGAKCVCVHAISDNT